MALGFYGATNAEDLAEMEAFARRYLGAANTAEAIIEGCYILVFGIILGVLTDISRGVAAPKSSQANAQTGKEEVRED